MSEETDRLKEILDAIEKLRKAPRDAWDKAAVVAQFISGVVLVVLGFVVTAHLDKAQQNSAQKIAEAQNSNAQAIAKLQSDSSRGLQEMQAAASKAIADSQLAFQKSSTRDTLDATNRTIVGEYFNDLMKANPEDRAAYIDALDVELGPSYSVPLAVRFAKPLHIREMICGGQIVTDKVREDAEKQDLQNRRTANDLLQRLALKSGDVLAQISRSGYQPDAAIADAYLGRRSTVQYRVTEVDDSAEVIFNGERLALYNFGDESPWIDISDKLLPGKINSFFLVIGNVYEGAGARLEMRIGAYQYDKSVRTRNWEPAGRMFDFKVNIGVDAKGRARFNGDEIQNLGMPKDEKCD